MVRLVLKLAVAGLIASAVWRLGSAYVSFYKFEDSVRETVEFGAERSEEVLRQRILDLALAYDIPIGADSVTIRLEDGRTVVEGRYTQPITLLPGVSYPWPFTLDVDAVAAR